MKNMDICDQSLVGIIITCVKDHGRKKPRGLTVVRDKYPIQKKKKWVGVTLPTKHWWHCCGRFYDFEDVGSG